MSELNRRKFLTVSSAFGGALMMESSVSAADRKAGDTSDALQNLDLTLRVNDRPRRIAVDARTTLLDALRDQLGLTGTKKGCDHGQCGACTVHLDGRRVLSCLTLAAMVGERKVTTIEGIAGADGALHPMQQAFVDHDAFQCGYCTPGQIMSAIACLKEAPADTDAEIREAMSGNLCRCAAYPNICAAIKQAKSVKAPE